jgi:hypothetical protein
MFFFEQAAELISAPKSVELTQRELVLFSFLFLVRAV